MENWVKSNKKQTPDNVQNHYKNFKHKIWCWIQDQSHFRQFIVVTIKGVKRAACCAHNLYAKKGEMVQQTYSTHKWGEKKKKQTYANGGDGW